MVYTNHPTSTEIIRVFRAEIHCYAVYFGPLLFGPKWLYTPRTTSGRKENCNVNNYGFSAMGLPLAETPMSRSDFGPKLLRSRVFRPNNCSARTVPGYPDTVRAENPDRKTRKSKNFGSEKNRTKPCRIRHHLGTYLLVATGPRGPGGSPRRGPRGLPPRRPPLQAMRRTGLAGEHDPM